MENPVIAQLECLVKLIRDEPILRNNYRVIRIIKDAANEFEIFDENVVLELANGDLDDLEEYVCDVKPPDYDTTNIILKLLDEGHEEAAKLVCKHTSMFIERSPVFDVLNRKDLLTEMMKRGNTSVADYLRSL